MIFFTDISEPATGHRNTFEATSLLSAYLTTACMISRVFLIISMIVGLIIILKTYVNDYCYIFERNGYFIVNFIISKNITRTKEVAQLSQRDRAAEWVSFDEKWKTGPGRQYFADITGLQNFFARCYGWSATSEYRLKFGDFAATG